MTLDLSSLDDISALIRGQDTGKGIRKVRVDAIQPDPNQPRKAFDEGAAKVRQALKNTPDDAWTQPWKLSFQGKPIFSGSRFLAYRQMFLNHLVHHRAQLGVYLRLNDTPLPATYGPSADDTMGF